MINQFKKLAALAAVVAVGAVACEDMTPTGPNQQPEGPNADGPATLQVLLTDAPADYIEAAWVDIGAVELVPADDSAGGPITLSSDGTDGMVNLLDLQGEATAELADTMIEPGVYKQLRLIVDSARVDLIDGYTFADGSTSMALKVPSGAQTGIKLNLWGAGGDDMDDMDESSGVMIHPGQTVLVLDFDVNQSFVIQGNPETPAGIKSMHFQPTLRVTVRDVAGSISGTVSGAADSINVGGLMVTAEPTGPSLVEGYQTSTATAMTNEDGTYTIHYVVPGDYAVSVAAPEGYVATPTSQPVTVGEDADVMGIDFTIDEPGSIAGTVTATADSIAIAELTVTAEDTANDVTVTATTDSAGEYVIDGVMPGEYLVTVDVAEGFITTPQTATVTMGPGDDITGVDFEIDAAGSIAGTVTAAADSISVVDLTVTALDTVNDVSFAATTDSAGVYTIAPMVAGDYLVTVGVASGFVTDPEVAEVTVGSGEAVADVDFAIDEGSGG